MWVTYETPYRGVDRIGKSRIESGKGRIELDRIGKGRIEYCYRGLHFLLVPCQGTIESVSMISSS